jgi:lysozyme
MSKQRLALAGLSGALLAAGLLAAQYEGERRTAYRDPVGIPTICMGHTKGVRLGDQATEDMCTTLLVADLTDALADVDRCTPGLPPGPRAAFTDFVFNVGGAKFCGSTLVRKARAGDLRGACAELSRWVYADGKVLHGLVKRRAAERTLCEGGLP